MKRKLILRLSKKNYRKQDDKKRKTRVRLVLFILILVFFKSAFTDKGEFDWWYCLLNSFLPMLMYEQRYGEQTITFENDYGIPKWDMEKEDGSAKVLNETMKLQRENCDTEELLYVENNKDGRKDGNKDGNEDGNEDGYEDGRKDGSKNGTRGGSENTILTTDLHQQTFTREQLENPDFLTGKIFAVDSNTKMTKEELDLGYLMDTDLSISDLKEWDGGDQNKSCKILIYHTHGSEAFRDSRPGKSEDTIIGVGSYLQEILEQKYHIPVYHDETIYDMINGMNDRSGAYENAYTNVTRTLKENPTIEVVIDLHRDGVAEDVSLLTEIDGKKTAKIMFLNGVSRSITNGEIDYLENPNRQMNLDFSFQMYLKGKELFGDYIRKIYVKSLRFNLHIMPRATLIEVGAQNNTLEEEKNAMEPLATILNEVLSKPQEK